MVIVKLDISNAFDSLCVSLVLDDLSGKFSYDYECGIKVDEDFETTVHELRTYFGFLKLALPPGFMVFVWSHFTSSVRDRIFKNFSELRDLTYADDGNIICLLSQALKFTVVCKPVFKLDGNLDFNMGKIIILTKEPTGRHVYERSKYFLQNDHFVTHNCIKIARNVEKLEPIIDCFVFLQLIKFCMNTCTQYVSVNITLPPQEQFLSTDHRHAPSHSDTSIAYAILKKGT
jgi:hypothetical protein